jgi:hypothetical protein
MSFSETIHFDLHGFKIKIPIISLAVLRHMKDCTIKNLPFELELYDDYTQDPPVIKMTGVPGSHYVVNLNFECGLIIDLTAQMQAYTFDNFYKVAVNTLKENIRAEGERIDPEYHITDAIFAESADDGIDDDTLSACYGTAKVFFKNGVEMFGDHGLNVRQKMARDLPFMNYPEDDFDV